MAHFAYSGPAGTCCGGCESWHYKFNAQPRTDRGRAKPAPCLTYKRLMNEYGDPIPWGTPSCKYFEPAKAPLKQSNW